MFLSVTPLVIFKGTSGQFPATFSATKTVSFWQEVWASPTVLCLGVPDITVGGVFRKHVQCCSRTIIVTEQSLLLRCGSFATAVDVSGTSSLILFQDHPVHILSRLSLLKGLSTGQGLVSYLEQMMTLFTSPNITFQFCVCLVSQ